LGRCQSLRFEHEHEAKAFLHDLHERLRAFELALHPDKTRRIRFGRHAAKQRASLGEGKPETFDFLGFTHFCTRSRKWGSFVIGRKTIKKRMRAKLKAVKVELRKRMHDPIAKTGEWVKQMLQGHLNLYEAKRVKGGVLVYVSDWLGPPRERRSAFRATVARVLGERAVNPRSPGGTPKA